MNDIRVAAEQARVAALMELADEYVIAAAEDTATARHEFSIERKTLQSALEAALQSQPFPVEAQAVLDLHQQIMNIPCKPTQPQLNQANNYGVGYKFGHRDARHAAAQLVAASPAAAAGVHQQQSHSDHLAAPLAGQDFRADGALLGRWSEDLNEFRRKHWTHWSLDENSLVSSIVTHLARHGAAAAAGVPKLSEWFSKYLREAKGYTEEQVQAELAANGLSATKEQQ